MQLLPFQFRTKQSAGRLRRFIRANIYTEENEKWLARREGECTHCGAWLQNPFQMPLPDREPGQDAGTTVYNCGIYGQHFNQCRIFPLVPEDLEEIEEPCGYTSR